MPVSASVSSALILSFQGQVSFTVAVQISAAHCTLGGSIRCKVAVPRLTIARPIIALYGLERTFFFLKYFHELCTL